jgi:membrane associated rhomboid family serine protease
MNAYRNGRGFFEIPQTAVYLLIAANIVVFGLCFNQSGTGVISTALLFRDGAMYSLALERHEYWRLLAYGFLHANVFHLATNMLCLALWGAHLERRGGPTYFLIIYICAVIFGAVIGNFTHPGPYLTVGASGGISGILGALLCLWILGKIDLLANFFIINIGLNIALALSASRIDWGAHLGGFAAGLIVCAILDLIEKANYFVLRCKFPEFVKVNVLLGGCALGLLWWNSQPTPLSFSWDGILPILEYALTCFLVIKLIDVALSLRHGLAIVTVALSAANAGLITFAGFSNMSALTASCASRYSGWMAQIENLLVMACSNSSLTIVIVAATSFVLTIFLYSQELYRGIGDVGFIGATLRAERKRGIGI